MALAASNAAGDIVCGRCRIIIIGRSLTSSQQDFGTVLYNNTLVFLERYSTKHVRHGGSVHRHGENAMKILISTFAVALALAFTGPAFAGATAANTEADCAKAGGTWNATTKMCEEKKM